MRNKFLIRSKYMRRENISQFAKQDILRFQIFSFFIHSAGLYRLGESFGTAIDINRAEVMEWRY
jgi:hypothetical protein